MSSPYEVRLAIEWLLNVAARTNRRREEAENLVQWLSENTDQEVADEFGRWRPLKVAARSAGFRTKRSKPWSDRKQVSGDWKRLRTALREVRDRTRRAKPDRTARRVERLAKATGLSREDVEILEVLLRYRTDSWLASLVDDLDLGGRRHHPFDAQGGVLGQLLGLGRSRVQRRLTKSSPLVRSGCVTVDGDGEVQLAARLERLAIAPEKERDVRRLLLGECPPPELEWADFEHLDETREDAVAILKGALATSARGVNVLIHGPHGTGKTTFAKVLGAQLEVSLFPVGEADERGDEPTRGERLSDLRLAQSLLGRDREALVVVDEAEDVLGAEGGGFLFGLVGSPPRRRTGSRVFLHRLLEENPAPTIWITNLADALDEGVLRRMNFVIEMRKPPARVRERIWLRDLRKNGISASEEDARKLTREFPISPGLANGAVRSAMLCGGGIGAVMRGARGLTRLVEGPRPPREERRPFDPGLNQADVSLKELADDIVATGDLRFSVCLAGPPGSGKSAWARHLSDRLDLEVLHKRTSDLLGKYVGESEKRIANAFQQALDNNAFLVFDEADSLLRDRRGAVRSWEVSQVNEMLTWMESHPLPFACTTNLGESLDSASLRRFVFKVKLGYLSAEQAEQAFRFFFELDPPAQLAGMRILTPGDFEVVRRKAGIRGRLDNADVLVRMLQEECDAKPERSGTVGF